MEYLEYRFTLDMQKSVSQVSIPVRRDDTGIRLLITLSNKGSPYSIKNGCFAVLSGTKPDGAEFENSCYIKDNSVICFDFANTNVSSAVGLVECELTLYGDDGYFDEEDKWHPGSIITTPCFTLNVNDRVASSDITVSEDESTTIDDIFSLGSKLQAESKKFTSYTDGEGYHPGFDERLGNIEENAIRAPELSGSMLVFSDIDNNEVKRIQLPTGGAGSSGGGASVVVTQTTGSSKTAVMSQKATTDELTELQEHINAEAEARKSSDDAIKAAAVGKPTQSGQELVFKNLNGDELTSIPIPNSPKVIYVSEFYNTSLTTLNTSVVHFISDTYYEPCLPGIRNAHIYISGFNKIYNTYVATDDGAQTVVYEYTKLSDVEYALVVEFWERSILTITIDHEQKRISIVLNTRIYT